MLRFLSVFLVAIFLNLSTLYSQVSFNSSNLQFTTGLDFLSADVPFEDLSDGVSTGIRSVRKQNYTRLKIGLEYENIWNSRVTGFWGVNVNQGLGKNVSYSVLTLTSNEPVTIDLKERFTTLELAYGINVALMGDLELNEPAIYFKGYLAYVLAFHSTINRDVNTFRGVTTPATPWHSEYVESNKEKVTLNGGGFMISFGLGGQYPLSEELYVVGGINYARYAASAFYETTDNEVQINSSYGINFGIKYIVN